MRTACIQWLIILGKMHMYIHSYSYMESIMELGNFQSPSHYIVCQYNYTTMHAGSV